MNDIKEKLVEAGFTEYEAKAYSILLKRKYLTATEISKLGGIPQGRIYNIISLLERKGFCVTIPGAVKKFKAVNPKTAFTGIIEKQVKTIEKIKLLTDTLEQEFNNGEENASPLDYIQVLTSKQSQINKFQELLENAKEYTLVFNKKPYAINTANIEDIKKFSVKEKELIQRGTKVKGIYEADNDNAENFSKVVSYFESIGEELRICDELPMKILISDNSTVMISLRNEGEDGRFNLSSMVVEHTDLTKALKKLFEFYWNASMTLDEYLKSRNLKRQGSDNQF